MPAQEHTERQFSLTTSVGALDAIWMAPARPAAQLLLAHGAGAGFHHQTMQALAQAFAHQGIATLRFNFPFMQQGKRRVDSTPVAVTAIVEAGAWMLQEQGDLPLLLGGHSFGGRMASHAVLEKALAENLADIDVASNVQSCKGLIFCSFPLHPAKKPAVSRAAHLPDIQQPMLFLSGTRDDLADATLLGDVVGDLHQANIHWLDTANHSYTVLKRIRTVAVDVFTEMAQAAREFVDNLS